MQRSRWTRSWPRARANAATLVDVRLRRDQKERYSMQASVAQTNDVITAAAHGTRRPVRHYIAGRWETTSGALSEPVYNPATGEVIAATPLGAADEVNRAAAAAAAAFPGWAATPVVQRVQVLFRFKALLEEHFDELGALVTLENGKGVK